jgi:hypothetical protein
MVTGGADALDDLVLQLRKTIVAWWEWACGAPEATHVSTDDPRYKIVTEHRGRDYLAHPPASSCGDLPHFGLEKIGVRLPWVNREARLGNRWRGSWLNINRLVHPPIGACPETKEWTPDADVQGGDVVVVANRWPSGKDAHAVCVLARTVEVGELETSELWSTAEYGNEHGDPANVGGLRYHVLRSGHILGARRIRVWLSLDRIVRSAYRQGLLSGAEVLPPAVYPSEAPTRPG